MKPEACCFRRNLSGDQGIPHLGAELTTSAATLSSAFAHNGGRQCLREMTMSVHRHQLSHLNCLQSKLEAKNLHPPSSCLPHGLPKHPLRGCLKTPSPSRERGGVRVKSQPVISSLIKWKTLAKMKIQNRPQLHRRCPPLTSMLLT